MNMQNAKLITAAEQALVDGFLDQAGDLPGTEKVAALRQDLMEGIRQNGLPTRRVEAWHYTDLRNVAEKDCSAISGPGECAAHDRTADSRIGRAFGG